MAITQTGQNIIDSIRVIPDLAPIFNSQVSGASLEPHLTILNETMAYMMGTNFPWKWNEILVPPFLVNSYQQDYATSVTNLAWLQAGDVLDVNNTAQPKTIPQVEVVRQLPRTSSYSFAQNWVTPIKFQVCWLNNSQLYYGTWGVANTGTTATRGNNPLPNTVITNPLATGKAMPSNPILQIKDANGNLLVLTTYGTTDTTAPVLPAGSAAGTTVNDGSCVWTVVDPLGQGFRILPAPGQSGVVWQFNLRGQAKPPALLTSLDTLLTPIPDEYIHIFRQGCITTSYRYSPEEKVRNRYDREMQIWTSKLMEGRMQGDREPESYSFVPSGGVVAPVGGQPISPGNPFGWPFGNV